ncbi:MAG TPA: hypothetical protein VK558_18780 [Patescibacteria group bacterium]|nr:hypothetical protein [Patescibacteria group bacterium]
MLAASPAAGRVIFDFALGVPVAVGPPVVYGPPVYYAPPPPVYYYYSPPVVAPPAPAAASSAYRPDNCREYQSTVTIGGAVQRTHGTACRQADGTWRIVN